MSVKMDELEKRLEDLKALELRLQMGYMQQGYVCGLINGLRMARGVISGSDYILEREEVQKPGDNSATMVMPKCDIETGESTGFVIMKFDNQGGLLKLEHT